MLFIQTHSPSTIWLLYSATETTQNSQKNKTTNLADCLSKSTQESEKGQKRVPFNEKERNNLTTMKNRYKAFRERRGGDDRLLGHCV